MKDLNSFWEKPIGKIAMNIVVMFVFFLTMKGYVSFFVSNDDDEIASALTACFFFSIYVGRFVAHLGIDKKKNVSNWLLGLLPLVILITAFISVVFATKLLSHFETYFVLFFSIAFFIFGVAVGMFIKLIRTRIHNQLQIAETSAAHNKSELQLLQSQLSPHFLFNTLNNLYGLSITEHEKLPTLLLKLSELLRYSVYEAKELYVPMKEELSYLKNYIDFEKLRIGERLDLKLDLEEMDNLSHKIAPMMLIVFVENAFKHAKNTHDETIFVEISLKSWGQSLLFLVKNSYDPNEKKQIKNSGFGLENVKKRLELLYPNSHDLQINEVDNSFEIMLRINAR